ncbi:hypothetical protein L210DRAFT_940999 [Boletus edulis BED1]|uniref:Uncharacterized protein n=1 Tax=Boletus edulis BED1 TaxID=1328754 RepID=A0AAD4BW76_BOLED|nr:hypothetical protein L210DRAFT_940999 [Boletus edulis BED1]
MNISLGLPREKIFVTKVHSRSATSGKRVSDDITLNSHPDVAAFQLIRQKHSLRAPPSLCLRCLYCPSPSTRHSIWSS